MFSVGQSNIETEPECSVGMGQSNRQTEPACSLWANLTDRLNQTVQRGGNLISRLNQTFQCGGNLIGIQTEPDDVQFAEAKRPLHLLKIDPWYILQVRTVWWSVTCMHPTHTSQLNPDVGANRKPEVYVHIWYR